MKLIVPIKNTKYLDQFIECGADEFYGGYIDSEWERLYGRYIEYNRRGNYGAKANFESEKAFFEMVSECSKRNVPFYLTMNALKISDAQRPVVRRMLEKFQRSGGTGVIFSDLNILEDICSFGLKPVVSSCAEVINHYTAKLYQEEGCKRIIFPRDITLEEMKEIFHKVPGLEYEMFFMNSGCRFTDGHCLGMHATEERALCEYCDQYASDFYRHDGCRIEETEENLLLEQQNQFSGLWKNTCACCNLYDVKDYIHSLKIVERVASEEKLMKQIRFAKANVELATRCKSRREYLEHMIRPDSDGSFCKEFMNCYYRTDMLKMEKRLNQIETQYNDFLNHFEDEHLKDKTEYVGINLSSDQGNSRFDYKIYFNTKASLDEHHSIVDRLYGRGMLRAVTRIHDTIHGSTERFDLGLAKRTVANMTYFFDVLSEKSELVKNNIDQILLLNRMKISDKPEDASAALYFFGFLEKNGKIEAIKTHFLTRFCKDVDQVDTKDEYRDDYYLDFLADTHISAFLTLVPFVKNVLRQCGGHLWMIGVDYFSNGSVKYKIYIKKRGNELYHALRQSLKISSVPDKESLIESLELFECWHEQHSELVSDGIAIGIDEDGKWSFNFYDFWI